MAKFEQIIWERFRDILKRNFKNHKNSEIASYPFFAQIWVYKWASSLFIGIVYEKNLHAGEQTTHWGIQNKRILS